MKTKISYFFTFIAISIILIFLIISIFNNQKEEHLQAERELASVTYKTILSSFRTHSEIIYINKINTPEIINIFKYAWESNESERDLIRDKLYNSLIGMYNGMKLFHLKQLHFHLPNNDSFLRFHRPSKYGDNLTEIRSTVAFVNRELEAVHGFEEGRIFNGYRFVYPLFHGEKHLGSVETSVSMQTIIDKFKIETGADIEFIIEKDVVEKKVFKEEQSNYIETSFDKNFMHEKSISEDGDKELEEAIAKYTNRYKKQFQNSIESGKIFNFPSMIGSGKCFIITFLPVENSITKEVVAYIIVKRDHHDLINTLFTYIAFSIFLILITAIFLYLQYRVQKSKASISHQNDLLEEVQHIGHLGYIEIDFSEDGKTFWSKEIFRLFGLPISSNCNNCSFQNLIKYVHKEDQGFVEREFLNSISTRLNYKITHRVIREDGEERYIDHECSHILDENKNVIQSIITLHDITTLKVYEMELEKTKERYEDLISHIPDILFRAKIDQNRSIIYINSAIEKLTGYKASSFLYNREKSFISITEREDREKLLKVIEKAFQNLEQYRVEYRIISDTGEVIWVSESGEIVLDDNNNLIVDGIINNITPQKVAYQKLQRFIDTQEAIVLLTDGKKLQFANKSFFTFFNYENIEKFLKSYDCVCQRFIQNDQFFHLGKIRDDQNWIDEIVKLPQKDRLVSIADHKENIHIFSVNINSFEDMQYVISFNDISETIIEKLHLQNSATKDQLTGAYNRFFFENSYKKIIHNIYDTGKDTGVIIFDIDHFKHVNDTYGHNVGDEVLKNLVKIVKSHIRKEEDTLIRWGGEEFLIFVSISDLEDLYKVSENLRANIESSNFPVSQNITCSFGGSKYIKGEDISNAIERADVALYKAKNSGRNRVVINLEAEEL
jgi:diguanylate cyclase (GGDEF)-like protein/PAS domain S-box-containing protein